jgi:hypothetical protein
VAGEGLAGVAVAALVAGGIVQRDLEPRVGGLAGEAAALAVAAAVCVFLFRGGRGRAQ